MTAILGIFPSDGRPTEDALVSRMLARMRGRGNARANVWRENGVVLAVARSEWEFGPDFSGPVLVLPSGDFVVAADASLYYREELRRKLLDRGVRPEGNTPSHLILAAYKSWGDKCAQTIEGDFSFIVWDRKTRRVVAARDSTGTRPLFFADLGKTLIVASSIPAILEHPDCGSDLDLTAIAVDAAGLIFSTNDRTAYRSIRRVNGAMTLVHFDGRTRLFRHWEPAPATESSSSSLDDGAAELRALLRDAVTERLDPKERTSIWLSGGWDSTAVFATGQSVLSERGEGDRLTPVSMALPADDPWCETGRTEAVATYWGAKIHWLDSEKIPLLLSPETTATTRPEPWAHEYEQMMRALVNSSRESGARVALNGHGGDFLFYGSPIFLADLLAGGHLLRLWREWSAMPARKPRAFFEYAIQPVLPFPALRTIELLRGGRRLHGYVERPIPFWIDRAFLQDSGLEELSASASPRPPRGVSRSSYETQWILMQPHFDRVVSTTAGFALEAGVESRLPLMDRRVIDFAMKRPWWERRSSGEDKHLIRHAMKDMLPREALAPRPFKTGSLGGYFARALERKLPELIHLTNAPLLAELGIVDRARLQNAARVYSRAKSNDSQLGVRLLSTLQAELWLRARSGISSTIPASQTENAAGMVA
jgi:asparagine synthase (glutamine-hydrolysing)